MDRRKEIYGQHREDIGQILRTVYTRSPEIKEGHLMLDYVNMLVMITPKNEYASFIKYTKGKSTLMIFDKHANLKYNYGKTNFCTEGYYVSTEGLNSTTVAKYIK